MKTMLGWYSGPLAFEIPSRLIEILPNVKLKLAVLKDPEITADKERLWEASGERGCNELHVKSFPLQMRELLGRGGAVPVARGAWVHRRPPLIVLVWIKAALQTPRRRVLPGPLAGIWSITNTMKIFKGDVLKSVLANTCPGPYLLWAITHNPWSALYYTAHWAR